MADILHITNGDITAELLQKSTVSGDSIVWREMLADGPKDKEVGSDAFWLERYAFFEDNFGISKLTYYDQTIKEILAIENIGNYKEVVLWFEFDVFCQINLIALCSYLLEYYQKSTDFYLVCTGKEKGKNTLQHLTDYDTEAYPKLYENRIKLSRKDLLFAQEFWNILAENDKKKLENFNFQKNKKFRYLKTAIKQYLQKFPQKNGLNQIENKLLQLIALKKFSKKELILETLNWQQAETIYGFTDTQYLFYLKNLETLYVEKNSILELNDLGKEKLEQ